MIFSEGSDVLRLRSALLLDGTRLSLMDCATGFWTKPMPSRSVTSLRHRLSRLTVFTLLSTTLTGCIGISWIEKTAEGEPKETGTFALSANGNDYEITRWWGKGQETYEGKMTLSIPRNILSEDCEALRFFLNDPAHEIQIAQTARTKWVTEVRPRLPDDSYPPCALLVSYGSFSEPQLLEGVAVTSTTGLIAKGERKEPHPIAWALLPIGIVADIYIFIGSLVTMPIWAPIGLMSENRSAKREQESKEKERSALPPPVAACWTTIDREMKNGGTSKPDQPFVKFEWAPGIENAYVLSTVNEIFSNDTPASVDTRVTLRQGRVQFQIKNNDTLWTDADVECGLRAGDVAASCVKLRK